MYDKAMLRKIVKEPNPVLHRRAIPVGQVTTEIDQLIDDMIETMHAAEGVGLAANQVGSSLDLLVACPEGRGSEIVLLNARLFDPSGRIRSQEGCLSVPGVSAEVSRYAAVTAQGINRKGEPVTLKAQDLLAKILQHEEDHLQGHLFFDRLPFWERRKVVRQYRFLEKTLSQIPMGSV